MGRLTASIVTSGRAAGAVLGSTRTALAAPPSDDLTDPKGCRRALLPQVLVASLSAVLVTALAAPAAAAPPRELSGTFVLVGAEQGPERIVGNGKVVFNESVILAMLEGDLVSTEPNREQSVCQTLVHSGTARCHGAVTFTGTVAGTEGVGTLTSRTQLSCDLSTYTCTGRNVVVQGTGALAGVRGQTAITVDLSTGTGAYTSSLTGT